MILVREWRGFYVIGSCRTRMNRSRVLVVALLCCLAPIAGVSAVVGTADEPASTPVVEGDGTAEYLAIPPDELDSDGFEHGELDVATAIASDGAELRSEFTATALRTELRTAETDEERRDILQRAAERTDDRIETLETRERAAVTGYSDGETDGTELLRTLSAVDAESETLLSIVREMHSAHAQLADSPLSEREMAAQRARLDPLSGPVRGEIRTAASGEQPIRIYVETRDDEIVLATVDRQDRFVREAHLRGSSDLDGEDQLGFGGAEERFEELYPWIAEENTGLNTWVVGGQPYLHHTGVYAVSAAHHHGFGSPDDLTTYISGATTDVFYETQQLDPEALPDRSLVSEDDGLELRLNWTRGGGPMGAEVVDAETEEPLDATIEINDERIGTTSGDRLWFVAPRGTVHVTVTHEDRTLETQITTR